MVYAAPLAARPGFPQGNREKADENRPGDLVHLGRFLDAFVAYTKDIPFLHQQAHIV